MLKLGTTNSAQIDKLGALAAKAAEQGNGTLEQCSAQAERRLKSGMERSADVLRAWLR